MSKVYIVLSFFLVGCVASVPVENDAGNDPRPHSQEDARHLVPRIDAKSDVGTTIPPVIVVDSGIDVGTVVIVPPPIVDAGHDSDSIIVDAGHNTLQDVYVPPNPCANAPTLASCYAMNNTGGSCSGLSAPQFYYCEADYDTCLVAANCNDGLAACDDTCYANENTCFGNNYPNNSDCQSLQDQCIVSCNPGVLCLGDAGIIYFCN